MNTAITAQSGRWFVRRPTWWAGVIVTACGIGHSTGSLLQSAGEHVGGWINGSLWSQSYPVFTADAVAWWYSMYSFGPMLLLLGAMLVWLDHLRIRPPRFIAWGLVVWVIVGLIVAGLSPLPLLFVAAALLLIPTPSPKAGAAISPSSSRPRCRTDDRQDR